MAQKKNEKKGRLSAVRSNDLLVVAIEGAITEIKAGSVLIPKTESDKAYNDANDRAVRILSRYKIGRGLFQL